MSYMFNLQQSSQSQMQQGVTVPAGNSRAIVLSPPQTGQSTSNINNNPSGQFPMVMHVGGNNPPVLLYQNSDSVVNGYVASQGNENAATAGQGIANVVLSPVSPVGNMHANSGSPTVPSVNMHTLAMSNSGMLMQGGQQQQTGDATNPLAGILSTLHAAGLQIVDANSTQNVNAAMNVPVVSNQVQSGDVNGDQASIASLLNTLQSAGLHVVENNNDKTLSISLPSKNIFTSGVTKSMTKVVAQKPLGNVLCYPVPIGHNADGGR